MTLAGDAAETFRVLVVTGANQGIGRTLVKGVGQRMKGAGVVYLTGRNQERVNAAAAELDPQGHAIIPRQLDVRSDTGPSVHPCHGWE